VFQPVEQVKDLEAEEKVILEKAIKLRHSKKSLTEEQEEEMRQQRFDILIKYSELEINTDVSTVLEKARIFNTLNEAEQRTTFEQLKVYYNKEMACLEIAERGMLEEDVSVPTHIHAERVTLLHSAIKHIMPSAFDKEYSSLSQIQKKKEEIDATFEKAKLWQLNQLDILEKTQKELKDIQAIMGPTAEQQQEKIMSFKAYIEEVEEDLSVEEMA